MMALRQCIWNTIDVKSLKAEESDVQCDDQSFNLQVIPTGMTSVQGNVVEFADGRRHPFDAIVFATGYRSGIKRWLQVRSIGSRP